MRRGARRVGPGPVMWWSPTPRRGTSRAAGTFRRSGETATIRHCSATVGSRGIGKVSTMPDERIDPSQNTQAFQAWVDNGSDQRTEPVRSKALAWVVGVVAGAVVVGLVVVALAALA
ncbi:hypothetical protein GCM10010199_23190 [Dactylosporangium roseum]